MQTAIGLGHSVLACGLGFAAAVSNPFTIGVAQKLAELPLFSGALLRVAVFISVYVILVSFLWIRIKKIKVYPHLEVEVEAVLGTSVPKKAYVVFIALMCGMAAFIALSPFASILRDLSLPFIALIFMVSAVSVGMIVKRDLRWVGRHYFKGAVDMSPAILLVFVSVLGLNFFIGSGSAKAFILMPVVVPMMDLIGVSRQLGVLAFQFGDGFSNVLYPTNAVLLIALGISGVSYGKWLRFVIPIQALMLVISVAWLWIAYQIGYGG
ncbi:MAG: AbgT family transporter [Clostridia bacterium]|nr:AbgT family transporter [Clostridia bacterium]